LSAEFLQFLFSGITVGAIYGLVGLGFSIIFNASQVINFAQGEFVMIGGMATVSLVAAGLPLPVAMIAAIILATLIGLALEKFAIEPSSDASVVTLIIITIGASIFLRGAAQVVWDRNFHSLPGFSGNDPIHIGGATMLPQSLWIVGFLIVIVVGLWLFFNRTLPGKAMLAASHNRLAARLVGINVRLVLLMSFALAAALGAFAGILIAPISLTYAGVGVMLGLKGFSAAIARHHGVEAARVVCGSGSDELIRLLTGAYAGPGDEVLFSRHGFAMYPISALACGAKPVAAPETDLRADVDALLAAVTEKTKILFLANPNNPTGSHLSPAEVTRLHAGLPESVLLVIDAAYVEYIERPDYEAGLDLAQRAANVVMLRTFSKIHGLAALRVGWAYGPDHVADVLGRVRGPFNVNAAAQAAAAAALADRDHVAQAKAHNDRWRPWLAGELTDLGLTAHPSAGNFILAGFPEADGKTAEAADAFLVGRGVITRRMAGYGLPQCLRITVAEEPALKACVAALGEFMRG